MDNHLTEAAVTPAPDFLAGGGEMGALMRSLDWSKTPLGPAASWPPALRMMVRVLLANRFPLLLWWGPEYAQLYNDAYRPILGTKHPQSMGQPASACWPEIWHIIGPLIDTPFHGGSATWMDDIQLEINRHGFVEETHFTIAYSPVPDETAPRGIGGVLATVHEITEKVVGERRVIALRDLGARATSAKTAAEACTVAASILTAYAKDVPFTLLYLMDADGRRARLAGTAGVRAGEALSPAVVDLDNAGAAGWPLAEAKRSETLQVVAHLGARFPRVPPGPWSDPPDTAVIVPIPSNKAHEFAGFLVAGVSARLKFDDSYRGFFELTTAQIATAIANARAYEEEKRRAEALAELDRAKTTFFSNVSHEFRTPLTLLLGPVEDALAGATDADQRERLEVVHRNALRLQKLVNTLLDFSRIEAGRIQASYEPTDLATFTADLASVFRAAVEKADMRLIVDCPPLSEPVYVDRDMYEKVVLNLVSNAFKFTLDGAIEVQLRERRDAVALAVRDTGTGIAPEHLPHIFERFHRVEGTRARTHEGTGIGLALVQELVKLHGGTVSVQSEVGSGSTFTVSIPKGKAHLPADRIGAARRLASTALAGDHYLEEALRWLPSFEEDKETGRQGDKETGAPSPLSLSPCLPVSLSSADRPRILLADDNADMRDYVRRLLSDRYEVTAVSDGRAAVRAARQNVPDLVLADVMMPELDGFGLLRELRSDSRTRDVPILLLSARAGEEARVDGLAAGADDYITKPFNARELLARIESSLELAKLRRETLEVICKSEEMLAADKKVLQLIVSGAPLPQVLDTLIRETEAQSPDGMLGSVLLLDDTGRHLLHGAAPSLPEAYNRVIHGLTIGPKAGSCGTAAFTRKPVDVYDIAPNPLWADFKELAAAHGLGACCSTPILSSGGELLGTIAMYYHRPHVPGERDRQLIGHATQLAGIVIERKRAEQRVRDSQERLQVALANSDTGTFRWNPYTGEFLEFDENLKRLFGFAPDEPVRITEDFIARVHPDDVPALVAAVDRCRRGADFEMEYQVILPAGRIRWLYDRAKMERDAEGRPTYLVGACTDITKRKQAEQRLQEKERRLRELIEALPTAVYTTDAAGRITMFNQAAVELAGRVPQVGVDSWCVSWKLYRPDGTPLPHDQCPMAVALKEDRPIRGGEIIVERPDGTRLTAMPYPTPLYDASGQLVGAINMLVDITERKQMEEALREADRRKNEFLAMLAHELRNPLAPIRNSLHLLRMAGTEGGAIGRVHEMMERQVNHMVRLVDDLLEVSRITRGKIELRKEPVELAAIIRSAVETSKPLIEAAGHRLAITLPPTPLILDADPVRLAQVVANLLNNAAKYTDPDGQIWLNVQAANGGGELPGEVVISVRDNGIGIPADMLPRVFDMFTQIDRTLGRAQGGLGIGLTLVRSLVQIHGGRVEAKSAGPGQGSEFIVRLPLAPAHRPDPAEPHRHHGQATVLPPQRLLIVDDNRDAADTLGMLLNFLGADVQVVSDGPAALETLRTYRPDAVLLDIGMPGMDGYEVARRIRQDPALAEVVLIALTGWGQEDDHNRSQEAGFDHHLVKPVDPDVLQALLASLGAGARAHITS